MTGWRTSRGTAVKVLGVCVVIALLSLYLATVQERAQKTHSLDFVALYVSGVQFFEDRDVYARLPFDVLGPIPEGDKVPEVDMHPNLNPPVSILLFAPLSKLPFAYAFWSWALISLACAAAAAWLMAGAYATDEARFGWSIGLLILLLTYTPTWVAVSVGQTTLSVLLLLAAGWRLARAGRECSAGVLLGATLAIKPFAGVLLVYFLALRRWRLVAWYACSFAAANLVALILMGPGVFARYLDVLKSVSWHSINMNVSLFGFLARLFGGAGGHPPATGGDWPQILGYAVSALLLGSLIPLSRRLPAWPSPRGIDIGYAYCLVLMLLISPLGWIYYFPILIISFLIIFHESRTLPTRDVFLICSAAAWLLSGLLCILLVGRLLSETAAPARYVSHAYTAILVLLAAMLLILGRNIGVSGKAAPGGR